MPFQTYEKTLFISDCCLVSGFVRLFRFVYRFFHRNSITVSTCLGIGSDLPALSDRPFEFIIAGAVCEMMGLSICHGLASVIERGRLLVVFFVATALVSLLVPTTYPTENFGRHFHSVRFFYFVRNLTIF